MATKTYSGSIDDYNIHIGTYLCGPSCPKEDPSNQHYYHHLTVNPDAWLHVLLDRHPQHLRGDSGYADPGNNPAVNRSGLGNYFQYMNVFYVEARASQQALTSYWIDEMQFYQSSQPENDISIASLWVGYWPSQNYWELGFNDGSFAPSYGNSSQSTFEIRYSTQPITNANYGQATLISPQYNQNGTGRIKRPNPWQKPAWTRFVLPTDVQNDNNKIYFAIKDVSSTLNGDGHNSPSPNIKTIDYSIRPGTPDTTPPTWPTGTTFSASATSSSSITLTWTAATDNVGVTGYTVQRCTGLPAACPDASFATVGTPTASPFVDPPTGGTGLSPNTDYSYHVQASDAAGHTSGWTNVVSAKTQPLAAPVITSSLTASGTTGSAFSYQITATNTPTSYSATGLPAWASINTSTGVISGTPSATGTTNITLRATNATGTGTATLVLTVTAAPPVSQNLMLGLNFSEGAGTTTQDVSGHNHTGALSNTTWTTGKNGSGVSFSGNANSYIGIPNESDFDFTTNFTVSLWMKTASFGSAWASLVSKGDSSWSLTRYNATNTLDFNTFSPSANDLQGTANVANDSWRHVAIVYDGTTKKVYLDGNIDAQANFTQTLSTNNFPVRIGGNAEYTAGAFNGSVDDVRIYNTPLTQQEIQTDMNTPLTAGGGSTPTPCNTVTPTNFSQAAYNSYGAPFDLFAGNASLVDAKCTSGDIHTIETTIGKTGDTTRIASTTGYYYDPGISDWAPFTSTCTGTLNGEWCAGPTTATITDPDISTASATNPAYIVGFTCSVQGGSWKCGCRDTTCANFSWQVQGAGR